MANMFPMGTVLSHVFYFLLLQLLPNLEYDRNMTVLCVNSVVNRYSMDGHTKWNTDNFIARRKNVGNQ